MVIERLRPASLIHSFQQSSDVVNAPLEVLQAVDHNSWLAFVDCFHRSQHLCYYGTGSCFHGIRYDEEPRLIISPGLCEK